MSSAQKHALARTGIGETILVLGHGLGGSKEQWRGVVELLAPHYTIITFDLAGSGESDPSLFDHVRHSTVSAFADDLVHLLHDSRLMNVVYVGHSISGMAGLLASIADPTLFRSIVTLNASARYVNDHLSGYVGGMSEDELAVTLTQIETDFALWSAGFAPQMMGNSDKPDLAREFLRSLKSYDSRTAFTVMRGAFTSDFRGVIPRVNIPVLVLQSHDDMAVPADSALWLAEHLPNGQLQVLDTTGHFPHVVSPKLVADAIHAFISGLT
jgi:sigma-B regulation protein RsbQ